jgi:REP element-mobilizing transposase RayT
VPAGESLSQSMSDPPAIVLIMRKPKQLALCLPFHGGKRRGAGRKPKGRRALVSHAARAKFVRATPVHVTLRVAADIPSLRSSRRFTTIRRCFAAARGRFGLRLVEFNVLDNHLHLIVEADADHALSVGMQGLAIRLAKALNAMLGRRGSVFADHYYSRLLLTPTELARAIRYVIENDAHHYVGKPAIAFSSRGRDAMDLITAARSWLVRIGWQRAPPGVRIEPSSLSAGE